MGAARLSGDQGGRVVTNSLIPSKVSHERKDTGETGRREVFDGGDGVSKRSIEWGNGEHVFEEKLTVCNNLLFVQFPLCHETGNFTT